VEVGEVDEVYEDDELLCLFNIDPNLTLDSLLSDTNDVTVPEERVQELSKKRKCKIFNILDISYYVIRILYYVLCISYYVLHMSYYILITYSLVLVFNRMSKKLKVVSKKLFRRKSKEGPEDTKHIDLTLVGQMVYFQRSEVILIFSYHFAI
jgi:hypothetical protein